MVAVQEPEGSIPATVTLTVQRTGGSVGVIEATWTVSSNDGKEVGVRIPQAVPYSTYYRPMM